ncbi:unnamed protein product [marine sediment metagenome]|uniref:Uncharacterized protein n=1 Tax=marine sediment metagenome TaxID=412755 RepID=X0VYE0_9ZZZZ
MSNGSIPKKSGRVIELVCIPRALGEFGSLTFEEPYKKGALYG